MSDLAVLNTLLLLVEVALASVILPSFGWLLARAYRRSAAGRRLVWVMVLAILLAAPLLALALPSLALIVLPAPPTPTFLPDTAPVAVSSPEPSGFSWTWLIPLAGAAWLAGLAKISLQHLVALVRLELMRRGAGPWKGPCPVSVRGCELLVSEECPGPMTWGAFRPVIMLPDEALDWPTDRLATVLRHEMAHVRRRDGLAQVLAVVACALYWPNPLVWGAARALRREAELAADDAVIAAGVLPSAYAGQLLELAAEWRERRLTPTGLAMAAPPALSRRVQSILSTDAIRTGATSMDALKLVLLGGAATAALTLARPSVAEVAPAAPAASPASQGQVSPTSHPNADQVAAQAPAKAEAARPRAGARSSAPQSNVRLAQQEVPAPPAPPAVAAAPLPPLPGAPPPVFIPRGDRQIPYNQVTDDPASPGYIAPGQSGAQHPVPAELAKQLNARKGGANQPWTLSWLPGPNGPRPGAGAAPLPPLPGAPGAVTAFGDSTGNNSVRVNGATYNFRTMTPEQRAELERKLAAIGPAVDKAIADAHVDEAVQKALASQDPKTRELVAKQLADLGPRIERAVAAAHMQELVQQRLAEIPQVQEALRKSRVRQADAEDQVAAQLEEQAKRARERAKRDREQLKEQSAPAPKN